jgi:hypothetical protein
MRHAYSSRVLWAFYIAITVSCGKGSDNPNKSCDFSLSTQAPLTAPAEVTYFAYASPDIWGGVSSVKYLDPSGIILTVNYPYLSTFELTTAFDAGRTPFLSAQGLASKGDTIYLKLTVNGVTTTNYCTK